MVTSKNGSFNMLEPMSLDVVDQASTRAELSRMLQVGVPSREWFILVPAADSSVDVYLSTSSGMGLRVGRLGARNLDKLIEELESHSACMQGIVEWQSRVPKIKFIPRYSTR